MPEPSKGHLRGLLIGCADRDRGNFLLKHLFEGFHVAVEIREFPIVLRLVEDDLSVKRDREDAATAGCDSYRHVRSNGLEKFGCHPGSHVVVASRNAVSDLRLYFTFSHKAPLPIALVSLVSNKQRSCGFELCQIAAGMRSLPESTFKRESALTL